MRAERLSSLVPFEALKLAAGVVLLSPYIPLLFMGEEYGETAPFLYFISHSDEPLIEAVRKGRAEEFAAFRWEGDIPDPQDETTFRRSRIAYRLREGGSHRTLLALHRELIMLRKDHPVLSRLSKEDMEVAAYEAERVLYVRRWKGAAQTAAAFHFGEEPVTVSLPVPPGQWEKLVDSSDPRWGGNGGSIPDTIRSKGETTFMLNPVSFALFSRS